MTLCPEFSFFRGAFAPAFGVKHAGYCAVPSFRGGCRSMHASEKQLLIARVAAKGSLGAVLGRFFFNAV